LILGCDPAFRHTGLCLYGQAEPRFFQINTDTNMDMVSSTRKIRAELVPRLQKLRGRVKIFSSERQLSVGANMSAMQFAAQCLIFDLVYEHLQPEIWVVPTIGQRRQHMRLAGVDISTDTATVRSFREQTGYKPRVSIHCVHAYYLCRAAKDVLAGKWQYRMPSREVQLIPGVIVNGAHAST
jgi:hypothetical protein